VKGRWQLDDSIQSKIIALALSMAAEIERDLISQRTRSATLQKRTGSHARSTQRAGQKRVGYFPTGNRKPIGKRIDPTVYRTALPHDRSESPQLAQEEWDEDAQSPNVIVRNNEKRPR
jgi:hypothetical protein